MFEVVGCPDDWSQCYPDYIQYYRKVIRACHVDHGDAIVVYSWADMLLTPHTN